MSSNKDVIFQLLDDLGISYTFQEHEPVVSVKESVKHVKGKYPVKNLAIKDNDKNLYMVVMDGLARLDIKKLIATLGVKKLNFVNEETLKERIGVTPGSVSIFNLVDIDPGEIVVILDRNIISMDHLGFHPNINTETIYIPGESLEKIIYSFGHTPMLVDLA